jgi:hypothetical protein
LASISPEGRFITLCVREPEATERRELHAAAAAVRDWDKVSRLADTHMVAAFVRQAAAQSGVPLPEHVERAVAATAICWSMIVLRLNAQLKRLVAALADAGIPVIVLKGSVLAPTLYPAPALRPYSDVDLVVKPEHEAAAAEIVRACGLVWLPEDLERATRARAEHVDGLATRERCFRSEDGEVAVDLQVDPFQLLLEPRGEAGRWARAVPVPHLPSALMLAPEDQLITLSVHVHRHGFTRLLWLKDLDLLLRRHAATLDWDLVHAAAREDGVQVSVWYALRMARDLLATPVPPAALERLGPPQPLRALYSVIWPTSVLGNCPVFFRKLPLRVLRREHFTLRGMVPNLVLLGRRREKIRAITRVVRSRREIGPQALDFGASDHWPRLKRIVAEFVAQVMRRAPAVASKRAS